MEIDLVGAASNRRVEDVCNLLRRSHLVYRSREDDALALLDIHLEVARGEQILVTLVATLDLLLILEVVVPIWCRDKLRIVLRELHMQPRETVVETILYTIIHRIGARIGLHVSLRQRVLVTEREERTQTQLRVGMCVDQRVANHQVSAFVNPQQLLLQNHATDTIGDGRTRRIPEVGDVFVTTRLIDTAETVQSQVERLVVLDDCLVERRKQYIGLVGHIDRRDDKSVVLASVATNDSGTHITATAVCSHYFALQRILQVSKFPFVKGKSWHSILLKIFTTYRKGTKNF